MQITLAILIGFLTGLGISLILITILVILGIKQLRNGEHIGNPQDDSPEIT
jgi:MFS superfamily sulfate permease-like transporter